MHQQHALMARQLSLVEGDAAPATHVDDMSAETASPPLAIVPSSPVSSPRAPMDARYPVVPGARLGRSPDGEPAWYVPHPEHAGRYLKVAG